ncbi:MAG: hypothetical protein J6B47_00945 [Prevotella sp.]|nr:hypothetical protein [Prevotella sp.]
MTENKRRKPYMKPSMEVIKVETTSILAVSDSQNSIAGFEDDNIWTDVEATE